MNRSRRLRHAGWLAGPLVALLAAAGAQDAARKRACLEALADDGMTSGWSESSGTMSSEPCWPAAGRASP